MTAVAGVPGGTELRANWKWFFAIGLAFVVLGFVALGNLVATTLITTIIIGLVMLVAGVVQVFGAFTHEGSAGRLVLSVLLGILYVVVAFDILANPLGGAIAITIVISLFLVVGGVLRIVSAFVSGGGHRILLLVTGVINILLGAWLWSGIPVSGLAIGLFVGIDLILGGITWMVLGWTARSAPVAAAAG
jgi:uncharacterized membrane protein HdeD (DUF308 family)